MLRSNAQFTTRMRLYCEDDGEIFVWYADRNAVTCQLGKVPAGVDQSFHFAIKGRVCTRVPT